MNKEKLNIQSVKLRNITENDIHELVRLSEEGFPGMDAFTPEGFYSHIAVYPEGQFCVEYEGKIIGSATSMRLNFNEFTPEDNYATVTDNGYIRNHNPSGEDLYGVDIVVHPDYRGLKVGSMLYEARRNLCINSNLKRIVFAGRIPNYHKVSSELTAEQYTKEVVEGKRYDPTLSFQLRRGFEYEAVIANYLPGDKESEGYAVLLQWKNPEYKKE